MIGAGIYYMTWVLKNKNLFGQFAWAVNIPLIIALIFTPTLVGKWKGMYKLNLRGYVLAVIGRALVVVAGYMGSVPLMMAFTALAALGQGPWQGDMNAVIASCSEYTYLTQGKRIDGTMYSCTSLGVKIGGGIGTAVVGWMLEFSGYVGTNATQPQSALDMMQFMYLWLPLIFDVLIMFALSRMNVEDANKKLKAEKEIAADESNRCIGHKLELTGESVVWSLLDETVLFSIYKVIELYFENKKGPLHFCEMDLKENIHVFTK